jgi:hypothetical protein
VDKSDARLKAYITDILKKDKTLNELAVKAAVRKGRKLGRAPIGAGVIREVRKSLGIDRPRAISYARNLLAKNPTLEAKKVIKEVGERFGISLQPPDISHLRPKGAWGKRATRTKVVATPRKKTQRLFGTASITREGSPEDVARFFRSLAQ